VPGRLVGQARHFVLFCQPDWPRRGAVVATSDEVRNTAMELAERGEETDAAVREILSCCGDHRVSLVRARQTLAEGEGGDGAGDGATSRAIELLDLALERGSWA
jgi:hypothetical protein